MNADLDRFHPTTVITFQKSTDRANLLRALYQKPKSSMFLSPTGKTRTSLSVDNDDGGEKSGYKKAEESRKLRNNNHLPSEFTNSTKTGVPTSVSFSIYLPANNLMAPRKPTPAPPQTLPNLPSSSTQASPLLPDLPHWSQAPPLLQPTQAPQGTSMTDQDGQRVPTAKLAPDSAPLTLCTV